MVDETLEQKIARVVREHVAVVPYDPIWRSRFERERDHLRSCLPRDLVMTIEHFGSTAVPGLAAKPIVDMLVEAHFEHWDRLLFRDYLIRHPDVAREYASLKTRLSRQHDHDRVAYTRAKTDFILRVTARAKEDLTSGGSSK